MFRSRQVLAMFSLSLFVLMAGVAAEATVYYVNDGGTSTTCTSWGDACPDLQTALGLASSGDQIWVATGTYKPTSGTSRTATFQLITGVEIYGGFDATETTLGALAGLFDQTILSGDIGTVDDNSDNSYHVVTGSGTDATAVLNGFTVTGGNADGASPNNNGGGMTNISGDPTVANCTFTGNSAIFGGGLSVRTDAAANVVNCVFTGNTASAHGGGMLNNGDPVVTNCTFIGNSASYDGGGGLANINEGSLPTVTNCTFSGNTATVYGGGMYNYKNSIPMVTNCILWGNTAPDGPEIYNNTSTPVVTYSDVQGGYTGTGNIDADPLFVDAAGGDLRLGCMSPCVHAGNNAAVPGEVTTDLDGNARFSDDGGVVDTGAGTPPIVDMGAYER